MSRPTGTDEVFSFADRSVPSPPPSAASSDTHAPDSRMSSPDISSSVGWASPPSSETLVPSDDSSAGSASPPTQNVLLAADADTHASYVEPLRPVWDWGEHRFDKEEKAILKMLRDPYTPRDLLADEFRAEEIAIIRAKGPKITPPPMNGLGYLSYKMRRKVADYIHPIVVPCYFYMDHTMGPHLPVVVHFRMFDERLIYADCPELREVLDPTEVPIEFYHEDGTFRRLNPEMAFNCRYRRRLLIFRPGRQPKDYFKYCIGLRELTYELFMSKTRTPCVPIKAGLAPPATKAMLGISPIWALGKIKFPFPDTPFARGDDYEWETDSDYESVCEQHEEPNPLVVHPIPRRILYNRILKEHPRFGRYAERVGSGDGADGSYTKWGFFETEFVYDDSDEEMRL